MLALQRREGQRIRILDTATGQEIWVVVWAIHGKQFRIGVEAPPQFEIAREEVIGKAKQ